MGQVGVTINGRTYTLRCADGEEARLIELAGYVKDRADALIEEFRPDYGIVGDDRVLLMAAILIADELWEVRAGLSSLAPAISGARADPGLLSATPSGAARSRAGGR
jgi:cell division protein ZapA